MGQAYLGLAPMGSTRRSAALRFPETQSLPCPGMRRLCVNGGGLLHALLDAARVDLNTGRGLDGLRVGVQLFLGRELGKLP